MKSLFRFKGALMALSITVTSLTVNAHDFNWARHMGGKGGEVGRKTATDRDGNVYIAGNFANKDTADFNIGGPGGQFRNTGASNDVFLAKYSPGGDFIWAKALGGNDMEQCYGMAVDDNNNVYITGRFYSPISNFNPGSTGGTLINSGNYDMFIAKYDANGNFKWANSMGGTNNEEGWDIAVDKSGNVNVAGRFSSPITTFSNSSATLTLVGTAPNTFANYDVFLVRYDSSGNYVWSKGMGSTGLDNGRSVSVDDTGNVYIGGEYSNGIDFGGGALTSAGDMDIFVAKYDPNGNHLWSKGMGGKQADEAYSIAADASGNVYITGGYLDTADFNRGGTGGTRVAPFMVMWGTSFYFPNAYVAKYDATGNFEWVQTVEGRPLVPNLGAGYVRGQDIATDASGNVYASFMFQGDSVDVTPGGGEAWIKRSGPSSQTAIFNGIIMKYDPQGNYQWVKHFSGTPTGWGDVQPTGIAVDLSGNVYATGYYGYNNSVNIRADSAYMNPGGSNPGLLPGMGLTDVFLVRFGCNDTSSSSIAATLACGEGYTLKDSVYMATGIYTQAFPNISGCDSIVTLDLTIIPIDEPVIDVDGYTLSVRDVYTTYQWFLNGDSIAGATDTFYTVTENGLYQVAVSNGKGCSETSRIYAVNNVSIDNASAISRQTRIYPNPATSGVHITAPVNVHVKVSDLTGKLLKDQANATYISMDDLAKGIYLLQITDENGVIIKTEKVAKTE